MGIQTLYRCFLLLGLSMVKSFTGLANDNRPCPVITGFNSTIMRMAADTTQPGESKKPADAVAKKTDEIIKEVPKSRKQVKPLAITTAVVKPIIVKPQIVVKPIIKIH